MVHAPGVPHALQMRMLVMVNILAQNYHQDVLVSLHTLTKYMHLLCEVVWWDIHTF